MNHIRANKTNPANAWLLATRPKTLPAAMAPVVVGSAMAYVHQHFALLAAIACLAVALLLQIGVNLANDFFDFSKGIDTEDRLGPVRVTQSGLIAPGRVKSAMMAVFILSLLPGLYLFSIGGWPVVVIGAASIIAALAYSGGPFPLASHGLGDLFVFIFFGLVAVCGTYYVQAFQLTPMVLVMGVIVGLMITAILVVNNLRDIKTDRNTGKRTLAVMIGKPKTRWEYTLLLAGAYALPAFLWLGGFASAWLLLPLATLPLALLQIRLIRQPSNGPALNDLLAKTAKLAFIFSVLLAIGLILS
ncbi:MAG: 1,4-dihydroxy-2-naphthoate polyprenyltransferase [Desulfobacteraceae bacterium]|jgi:1,4-dihydroxy-2-naphthoate octaprenyltransferase|nr:1,4-dihydroxy-2-naphthoate polyprenyltransferase [Desulfobacteraceae bacterium]